MIRQVAEVGVREVANGYGGFVGEVAAIDDQVEDWAAAERAGVLGNPVGGFDLELLGGSKDVDATRCVEIDGAVVRPSRQLRGAAEDEAGSRFIRPADEIDARAGLQLRADDNLLGGLDSNARIAAAIGCEPTEIVAVGISDLNHITAGQEQPFDQGVAGRLHED